MEMRITGDKHYRESEHFPTYYKEGGFIPGSTNSINYNKTQSRKAYYWSVYKCRRINDF